VVGIAQTHHVPAQYLQHLWSVLNNSTRCSIHILLCFHETVINMTLEVNRKEKLPTPISVRRHFLHVPCLKLHPSTPPTPPTPNNKCKFVKSIQLHAVCSLYQCFSTAGPWHQLYRAARGLRKLQYATIFH